MVRQIPAAFLSIKTQFDNLGDALINRELCRLVSARADTWVDFSRAPADFERAMGVSELPGIMVLRQLGFLRLITAMLRQRIAGRTCYLFLNPGGLGGNRLSMKGRFSASLYNCLLSGLRRCGVRICHVGISYDSMGSPELRIARWRRRQLHFFAVRDRLSRRYVDSVGMHADAIVPDLSFNLYSKPAPRCEAGRDSIAFSFRFDGKSSVDAIRHAVRGVIEAAGRDREYLFIAQVSRDEPGMEALRRHAMELGARARLVVCVDDIDALCRVYATCRAIYSNRLHALLMAAYSGATPLAMVSRGKQPKIEGLFGDLGLDDLLLDIDDRSSWRMSADAPGSRKRLASEYGALQAHFERLLGPARVDAERAPVPQTQP